MSYRKLCELRIEHEYYADGICPELTLDPTDDTARRLRVHRVTLVRQPGAICLVQDDTEGGAALSAGPHLRFRVLLRHRDFDYCTDPATLRAAGSQRQLPLLFRCPDAKSDVLSRVDRTTEEVKDAGDAFAIADIAPGGLGADWTAPMRKFRLPFAARKARWAYYCVTNLGADAAPQIVDSTEACTDLLTFSAAGVRDLQRQPDAGDQIAEQLSAQYPGLRCFRLVSDQSIACRQNSHRSLTLWMGGERKAGPLPLPGVRSLIRDDLLFCVIQHRNPSFQTH